MSETPPFWFQKAGLVAWFLSPLSMIYGHIAAKRMVAEPGSISKVPVFCVGNLVAGGAGKTPTAIAIAKIARNLGRRPGFLSRGFGGGLKGPIRVDIKSHNAHDVGDEPLILALYADTVVSQNRPMGAALLEEQGVDFIIMDDGFQNPSLHKDYSLVVVDARRGVGNGFCIPAGPLRANLGVQLAKASALLLIGKSDIGTDIVRKCAKMAKPILSAEVVARKTRGWKGEDVFAYSGIADPLKFHASLEAAGVNIVGRRNFHDHHPFSAQECEELMEAARSQNLILVTTEKDAVRLVRSGSAQQELRAASKVLHVDLEFENPKMVELMIRDAIKRAAEFRLKN